MALFPQDYVTCTILNYALPPVTVTVDTVQKRYIENGGLCWYGGTELRHTSLFVVGTDEARTCSLVDRLIGHVDENDRAETRYVRDGHGAIKFC